MELEGWRDSAFAERLFIYHYRVYDRYRQPVASMALLLDDGWRWRPARFGYQVLDCRLQLDFPVVKLRDWDRQRIIELYRTIDWLLRLPASLESRVRRGIHLIGEGSDMAYLSSLERYGLEQGLQQGQAAQLLDMLELRFGTLPEAVRERVAKAAAKQLRQWARNFVYPERLEQVFAAE